MIPAKKFTVFKYTEVLEPGQNPYKIVPTFWIKNEDSNNVMVPYPPEEELAQVFDRIFNCQLPLTGWEEKHVIIEREVGKPLLIEVFTRIDRSSLIDGLVY